MTEDEASNEAARLNKLMNTDVWRAVEHESSWGVWDGKSPAALNAVLEFTENPDAPGEWLADFDLPKLPDLSISALLPRR